jgi:hypothetical protein
LHGGGRRFEPDAVHQRFAAKSCAASPRKTPETPADNPMTNKLGAAWCGLGATEAINDR